MTLTNNSDKIAEYILKHQPKVDCVYADPPWSTQQKGSLGAEKHYHLMSTQRIKDMPIKELTKDNAVCFLWATNAALPDALEVLEAWGFEYRGYYFWGKAQMGLGQYFRNATEIMLLGTKGKMLPDCRNQVNWNLLPRQEHSKKPEEVYAIIERMYKNRKYLELFARARHVHPNWLIWGDEAEGGSDIVIPGYPVPEYSKKARFGENYRKWSEGPEEIGRINKLFAEETPDKEKGA